MTGPQSWENLQLVGTYFTDEVTALSSGLPIGETANAQRRTMARLVIPAKAGNVLEISGQQRVTNDVAGTRYTVGVGYYFWAYDVDDGLPSATRPWWQIGPSNGDNVTPDRHHMPLHLGPQMYIMPETWIENHRIVIVFRADAHSTQWDANAGSDKLTVDDYGTMKVHQYILEL